MKPTVILGFLGTTLDRIGGADRWKRWRPSVAMCQQKDLPVSRVELIVDPGFGITWDRTQTG